MDSAFGVCPFESSVAARVQSALLVVVVVLGLLQNDLSSHRPRLGTYFQCYWCRCYNDWFVELAVDLGLSENPNQAI